MNVDETGQKVFESQEVQEKVTELQNQGAKVMLGLYNSVEGGDVENQMNMLEKTCDNIVDPNGVLRSNYIVVLVSLQDRSSGVYYGSVWSDELDDVWVDIVAERLNPKLRDGDTAQGYADVLDGIYSQITNPAQNDGGGAASEPAVSESEEGSNVGMYFLVGSGGLLAAGGGVGGGVWLRRRSIRLKAWREKTQADYDKVVASFVHIDETSADLKTNVALLSALLVDEEKEEIDKQYATFIAKSNTIISVWLKDSDVLPHSAIGRANFEKLAKYDALIQTHQNVLAALDTETTTYNTQTKELFEHVNEVPQLLSKTSENLVEFQHNINVMANQNWFVQNFEEVYENQVRLHTKSDILINQNKRKTAHETLERINDTIVGETVKLHELPRIQRNLSAAHGQTQERFGGIENRFANSGELYEKLTNTYEPQEYAELTHTDTVKTQLDETKKLITDIGSHVSMSEQKFDLAQTKLTQVAQTLDEVEKWCNHVEEVVEFLDKAPAMLNNLQNDIDNQSNHLTTLYTQAANNFLANEVHTVQHKANKHLNVQYDSTWRNNVEAAKTNLSSLRKIASELENNIAQARQLQRSTQSEVSSAQSAVVASGVSMMLRTQASMLTSTLNNARNVGDLRNVKRDAQRISSAARREHQQHVDEQRRREQAAAAAAAAAVAASRNSHNSSHGGGGSTDFGSNSRGGGSTSW